MVESGGELGADDVTHAAPTDAYTSTTDLETRGRIYKARFFHDASCGGITAYLNASLLRVLEAGCGTMRPLVPIGNKYTPSQELYGTDLSMAMLLRARQNEPRCRLFRASATKLPLADRSIDLIWARHMLYDVDRPQDALREFRRCLHEGGVVAISTNSSLNKPEMHRFHAMLADHFGVSSATSRGSERFSAENAPSALREVLPYVLVVPYRGALRLDSARQFIDFYTSTRYWKELVRLTRNNSRLWQLAPKLASGLNDWTLTNNGAIVFATSSHVRYAAMRAAR